MFDIGFSELLLVLVIGLIVLGPERLPVAIKTVAGWIRAVRSLATSVQQELAQELKLQELQDGLKKVEEAGKGTLSPELKESIKELRKTADSVKRSYHESMETGHQGDNASPAAAPSATLQSTAESTVADTPAIDQPLAARHNSSPAKETPSPVGEDK